MLPFAGIVVVWSGNEPRLDTFRIPAEGLLVGRSLAALSDERISGQHAWIRHDGEGLQITDAGSRNGTYVEGRAVPSDGIRPLLPAIVRMGRTVAVVVQDIRPYENVPISKRGDLVVAGSLDRIVRGIDLAAIAEDHVTIIGGGS